MLAHAQKPHLVFRRNGRVHLNRQGRSLLAKWTSPFKSAGASVQSTTGSRGVRISGGNAGYTMFRVSVNGTGYPLYSPVSPLHFPYPCVTVFHHVSTGLYQIPDASHSNVTVRDKRCNGRQFGFVSRQWVTADAIYTTNRSPNCEVKSWRDA